MGKPNLPIYKTVSYKHWKYSPPHWTNNHVVTAKLLVPTHNIYFIDWGPHGCFLQNCPEHWNKMVSDYVNKIVWQNSP
jgi:hypothetical protein